MYNFLLRLFQSQEKETVRLSLAFLEEMHQPAPQLSKLRQLSFALEQAQLSKIRVYQIIALWTGSSAEHIQL